MGTELSPLIFAPDKNFPVLPVTVTVTCLSTLLVVEIAVMVTSFVEREPRAPPASRPVITPVFGSTLATDGSDELHSISLILPVDG